VLLASIVLCAAAGDTKLLGPFCHQGECFSGKAACDSIEGVDIAGVFCMASKNITVLGPFCYEGTCYKEAGSAACKKYGGTDVSGVFCLLYKSIHNGKPVRALGPLCHGGSCWTTPPLGPHSYNSSGSIACGKVGGTDVGGVFCLTDKSSVSLLGPFYHKSNTVHNGFLASGRNACGFLGGYQVGGMFCLTKTSSVAMGPWCYGKTCYTAAGGQACRQIKKGKNVDGVFCLVGKSTADEYNVLGPFCYGQECDDGTLKAGSNVCGVLPNSVDVGGAFCLTKKKQDKALGPFWSKGVEREGSDVVQTCKSIGGFNVNDKFCLTDKNYHAIGPLCAAGKCYAELDADGKSKNCDILNGAVAVGGQFCLSTEPNEKALGPFCHAGQCFAGDGSYACGRIGGGDVGGIFCISPGPENMTTLGPFCNGTTCPSAEYACDAVNGAHVSGKFCLTTDSVEVLGPFCHGDKCYTTEGSAACTEIGGADVGGMFCLLGSSTKAIASKWLWLLSLPFICGGIAVCAFCAFGAKTVASGRNRGHSVFSQHGSFLADGSFMGDRIELQETGGNGDGDRDLS